MPGEGQMTVRAITSRVISTTRASIWRSLLAAKIHHETTGGLCAFLQCGGCSKVDLAPHPACCPRGAPASCEDQLHRDDTGCAQSKSNQSSECVPQTARACPWRLKRIRVIA